MKMRSTIATVLLVSSAAVIAQSAGAADLSMTPIYRKAPAIVAWDWTGPYVGAYVGVGVSKSRSHDPRFPNTPGGIPGDLEHTGFGFAGGGTLGYNYQLNWGIFGQKFVVGVEGDIGYFDAGRKTVDWDDAGLTYENKTRWLATARARVGLTDGPNFNYVTGGYAALNQRDINRSTVSGVEVSQSQTASGWVVGSGIETMLGGGWSAKSESLYVNVDSGDTLANAANGFQIQTDRREFYTQRFGLNYQFGAGKNGPLPQTNWSGLYVGGVFGGAAASVRGRTGNDTTAANQGELGNNGTGFTAGGQVGYNWMIMPKVVVGVEGDISYLGIDHMSNDFFNAVTQGGITQAFVVNTSWIATARGRVAYNTGPALLYATGGGAWVHTKDTLLGPAGTSASSSKTLSGWTVGGGIETVLWGNWSTKTEYLYVDAGKGDTYTTGPFTLIPDHKFHLFRSGIVYRFNGNPLSSKF
jgi:outer membrane immunogenic protein